MGKKINALKTIAGGGASIGSGIILGSLINVVVPVSTMRFIPKICVYLGTVGLGAGVGEFAATSMTKTIDQVVDAVNVFKVDIDKANQQLVVAKNTNTTEGQ